MDTNTACVPGIKPNQNASHDILDSNTNLETAETFNLAVKPEEEGALRLLILCAGPDFERLKLH
jgi:hypothetical protein